MNSKIIRGFGVFNITEKELDEHLNNMLNDDKPLALSSDLVQYCLKCCREKSDCECEE